MLGAISHLIRSCGPLLLIIFYKIESSIRDKEGASIRAIQQQGGESRDRSKEYPGQECMYQTRISFLESCLMQQISPLASNSR